MIEKRICAECLIKLPHRERAEITIPLFTEKCEICMQNDIVTFIELSVSDYNYLLDALEERYMTKYIEKRIDDSLRISNKIEYLFGE